MNLLSFVSSEGSITQVTLTTARWANYDNMKKDAKNPGKLGLTGFGSSK